MGTRSVTIIMDGNEELCRIYRQYDGYPDGHGLGLAKLLNGVKIVNGFGLDMKAGTHANGMGCLAAQIIQKLKADAGLGGIYLEAPGGEVGDWVEYVYVVRGSVESGVCIECGTHSGPPPFNLQKDDKHVFSGTPAQWLAKYDKPSKGPSVVVATVVPVGDVVKASKPARKPTAKQAAKIAADRVERAFNAHCKNIQIPILDVPKVFERGKELVASGFNDDQLGAALLAFCKSISKAA